MMDLIKRIISENVNVHLFLPATVIAYFLVLDGILPDPAPIAFFALWTNSSLVIMFALSITTIVLEGLFRTLIFPLILFVDKFFSDFLSKKVERVPPGTALSDAYDSKLLSLAVLFGNCIHWSLPIFFLLQFLEYSSTVVNVFISAIIIFIGYWYLTLFYLSRHVNHNFKNKKQGRL